MTDHRTLQRELGVPGAVLLGLGSILGTGVFVSIGLVVVVAGGGDPALGQAAPLAIGLAAFVALCNGLSSAQLAAAHPVAGGTYEYGYRFLHPAAGFTAGWLFLLAKSASAATAALGVGAYLLPWAGVDPVGGPMALRLVGGGIVALLSVLVLAGLRRSNQVNAVLVTLTLAVLVTFICVGVFRFESFNPGSVPDDAPDAARPGPGLAGILHAAALAFVAFTGYGRIATLGEEVNDPRRTIPRAVILTLVVTAVLYTMVSIIVVGASASDWLPGPRHDMQTAPLEWVARAWQLPGLVWAVTIGAALAMIGVLLNLILGLSRVALAMGRRGDMPAKLATLNTTGTTPTAAVIAVALLIGGLAMIGDVKTTWTFSAFTVLLYYGLTNAAALRLPAAHRLYPRAFARLGLLGCIGLAAFIPWPTMAAGGACIAAGLVWHAIARRMQKR